MNLSLSGIAISCPRPESGFSLVEIMVAMVAGLLLAAGMGQIFVSTKQSYYIQDQLARLQENGRYAIETLNHDARMAGSLGCNSRFIVNHEDDNGNIVNALDNTLNDPDSLYNDFATPVSGFDAVGTRPGETYSIPGSNPPTGSAGDWAPVLPNVNPLLNNIVMGTDILVLRGRVGEGVRLRNADATSITLDAVVNNGACSDGTNEVAGLCRNNWAMVADCMRARVFQVSQVLAGGVVLHSTGQQFPAGNSCSNWTGAAKPCLNYAFPTVNAPAGGAPAVVSEVATVVYFISPSPTGGPSLYQRIPTRNNGNRVELVEGVENMQILYGINVGDTTQFVPASDVAEWSTVTSIRMALLLRTPEEVSARNDTVVYSVNGTNIDPADDRRLRRVVTTTIGLRNKFR